MNRLVGLLLVAVVVGLSGCGESSPFGLANKSEPSAYSMPSPMLAEAGAADESARGAAPGAPSPAPAPSVPAAQVQRKMIYTVDIRVEVSNFAEAQAALEKAVTDFGGFVSDATAEKRENGAKDGSLVAKIPPDKLNEFLGAARLLGEVQSESKNGQDITMEYVDLSARLSTKQELEKELLNLLRTSSPRLADKLEVERELARVREEIETVQGRLRYYDAMVGMATVTVRLFEPRSVLPEDKNILFEAISDAFEGFLRSIGALVIFAAVTLPWGLGLLFVLWLIRVWWRHRRRAA